MVYPVILMGMIDKIQVKNILNRFDRYLSPIPQFADIADSDGYILGIKIFD
jgi:hypothetical protein